MWPCTYTEFDFGKLTHAYCQKRGKIHKILWNPSLRSQFHRIKQQIWIISFLKISINYLRTAPITTGQAEERRREHAWGRSRQAGLSLVGVKRSGRPRGVRGWSKTCLRYSLPRDNLWHDLFARASGARRFRLRSQMKTPCSGCKIFSDCLSSPCCHFCFQFM